MNDMTTHHPRRGSDVEAWLMRQRDAWVVVKTSENGKPYVERQRNWWALNEAVKDYQRRADAGIDLEPLPAAIDKGSA